MGFCSAIHGANLFSSLPTTPPPSSQTQIPNPPIPIPKYPIPRRQRKNRLEMPLDSPDDPNTSLAFNTHHRNSKYYKPVKPGQKIPLPDAEDRSVVIGSSGISYQLPGAPFEFMFSYSETPKAQPIAMREPAFLPFAPPTMPRPWTGKAPMKSSKRKIKLFDPLGGHRNDDNGIIVDKRYLMHKNYELGKVNVRPREEVLGEPLTKGEIREMVKPYLSTNKQVNLGRDGLTHNMLELIHTHWRRQPVCKVRCLGVPTVDMDNICRCLEDKAGGKIIHRVGGVVFIFRGRNYEHRKRPQLPLMLWKPAAPVYPKLIQDAPEGLTEEEAVILREKGKRLLPICKLAKNGVYVTLARDVRTAFEGSILVKIDCKGVHASDYKKLGAKLKELVPCVLLSFDDEQILMWRGKDWKSMYQDDFPSMSLAKVYSSRYANKSGEKSVNSSPKMTSLWQNAIKSGKASVLDEICSSPDDLLSKVEKFELSTQAIQHSYPARIHLNKEDSMFSKPPHRDNYEDEDSFEPAEISVPLGSLPIDIIAKQLYENDD